MYAYEIKARCFDECIGANIHSEKVEKKSENVWHFSLVKGEERTLSVCP